MILTLTLPLISALLLIEALPPNNLEYLAWIIYLPYFAAIYRKSFKRSAAVGIINGILVGAGLFYGVIPYYSLLFLPIIIYISLNMAVFSLGVSYLHRHVNECFHILIPPLLWTSLEYLRTIGPISFPASLALSQYQNLTLIQIAGITGPYGVSFLVMLVNAGLFKAALHLWSYFSKTAAHKRIPKHTFLQTAASIGLVLIIIGWGKQKISPGEESFLDVAIIQGSIPTWCYRIENWEESYARPAIEKYFQLTDQAIKKSPDIVVWPESSIRGWLLKRHRLKDRILKLAREGNCLFVLGTQTRDKSKKEYNSCLIISPQGKIVGQYDKTMLIPWAEREFAPGKKDTVIETRYGCLGTPICFESIYPSKSRQLIREGADMLFVLTNDANFKKTNLAYLHAMSAVFRAVENRSYVVRAAQTGISMIIDPYGRILKESDLYRPIVLEGKAGLRKETTFYSEYGDLFAYFCLFAAGSMLFISFRSSRVIASKIRSFRSTENR
ncbi:MAG: apolipoprotein N-acyltransferase [bacterium]